MASNSVWSFPLERTYVGNSHHYELICSDIQIEDHCWAPFMFEISNKIETLDLLADPERLQQEIKL